MKALVIGLTGIVLLALAMLIIPNTPVSAYMNTQTAPQHCLGRYAQRGTTRFSTLYEALTIEDQLEVDVYYQTLVLEIDVTTMSATDIQAALLQARTSVFERMELLIGGYNE